MSLRTILCGLLFCALAGLPAATRAETQPDPGADHLTIAAPWHVESLDPSISGDAFLRLAIAETLVEADQAAVLQPGLATSWTVSDDGLTWHFPIREDVVFHDGTPLTAALVAAYLTRAESLPGILDRAPITSIDAEGGAVRFTLSTPFAALPALLAHGSTVILAPSSFDDEGRAVDAIGTGPFRVTNVSPPQSLDAERFDGYWGPAPEIASLRYLSAGRAETRALLAESGDADMVFLLDPAGFARLSQLDGLVSQAVAIPRVTVIKVNLDHPALAAPEARQALSLAIDRAGIAAGILRFPGSGATQIFPPILSDWHQSDLPPLDHDPEAARDLLAGLGWAPGEDAILTRDGERFALTLRTFTDRPELPLIAAALQDQWRAIGVELTVSIGNFSEIPAGHQDGSLDVALYARNYGLTPDPIGTVHQDYGPGGGDWGAMNWRRPDVAQALATIARSADPEVRAGHIETVVQALQADLPVIPILWYQYTVAYADGLENVIIDPLERRYGLRSIRWAD